MIEEVFSDKFEDVDHMLLGGITASLNALFKEVTKSSGDLHTMQSTTSTLIFARAPNIYALIEVEKSTYLLRSALQGFADDFSDKYSDNLINFKELA